MLSMKPRKTYVYIDSFNLYYGILNARKKKGFKWLNLEEWLKKIFKPTQYDIHKIKFFTANVSATPKDSQKPIRQSTYFRALKTLPLVELIKGNFQKKKIKINVTDDVSVIAKVYEEKGTDVNIATHIVNDAHKGLFSTAIIVSNDSDLADAVRIVSKELGLEIITVNPCRYRHPSTVLAKHATFTKTARDGQIISSQFPETLTDSVGTITKPKDW